MIQRSYILKLLILFALCLTALFFVTTRPGKVSADANIGLEVSPASQSVPNGNNATLTLIVTNTNASFGISGVTIDDTGGGRTCDTTPTSPGGDDNFNNILDVGEIWNYNCTITNVTSNFSFAAQVNGVLQDGFNTAVNANDTASVTVALASINVIITDAGGDTKTVNSGGSVGFAFRIRNNGAITLTNVIATHSCDSPISVGSSLNPGQQTPILTCQFNNVTEGRIVSIAATGTPTVGDPTPVADAEAVTAIVTEIAEVCPLNPGASIDMAAYWKLDEATVPPFDDYYSGHNGTCPAGGGSICPSPVTGQIKGAQSFNGINTRITVPEIPGDDAFNWDNNDNFSIELWMKGTGTTCTTAGISNNEVMIGRTDNTPGKLQWWVGCSYNAALDVTQARFLLQDVNGNEINLSSPQPLNNGQWHHIVAVRDGAGGDEGNYLYVDGVLAVSQLDSSTYTGNFSADSFPVTIGWLGSGFHFEGTLDEIAIYGVKLPESEIIAHYANGAPRGGYCGGAKPLITSTPILTGVVGTPYNYDVDADGDPVPTYTLGSTFPAGMTIDTTTGLISWTPASSGAFDVEVIASNTEGTDDQAFTINVVNPNTPPDIVSTPVTTGTVSQPYSYQVVATGDPAPTYSLDTAPAGMVINSVSGLISWTPDSAGAFNVTVRATNLLGSDTQPFTIAVTGPGDSTEKVFIPILLKN